MSGLVRLAVISVGLVVASWALMAFAARRLPPGAAKDLAGHGRLRFELAGFGEKARETAYIQSVRGACQPVTGADRLDPRRGWSESPTQPRHLRMQRPRGIGGERISPQRLRQLVGL